MPPAPARAERARHPRGRPRRDEPLSHTERESLLARMAALEQEVVVERTRAELSRELPHLFRKGRGEKGERPPGSVAGRGRGSGGRRRAVRPPDTRADESDA